MLRNSRQHYGSIARMMHWLSAFIIIGLFLLGLWMADLSYYDRWYQLASQTHHSIGFLLMILIILRMIWRYINIKPDELPSHGKWTLRLAWVFHWLMYLIILTIGISGYFILTAKGQDLEVFNWFTVSAILPVDEIVIKNLEDKAGDIHKYSAFLLMGMVCIHALAALKHHFIDKDSTLRKMLFKK